jgi:alpha-N-acetylglucosaminidase
MIKTLCLLVFVVGLLPASAGIAGDPAGAAGEARRSLPEQNRNPEAANTAARGVLERITCGKAKNIRLELIPAKNKCDTYIYSAKNGILTLQGSSPIALCRAFHDYARASNMGTVSWADFGLSIPEKWPDADPVALTTPFEIRHAYNAVTSGYTTPYWTWERWEKELDWQAAHGFNMILAPVATEAIMERVWLKAGLTQEEIDTHSCGPAHLPFLRMGCIVGIEGPLPPAWHADQIALQHKILARMRELGIHPVIQGFNGFVPHAYARIHPEVTLHDTCWNGAYAPKNRAKLMDLEHPQFTAITRSYAEEWRKEFGEVIYVLVDSFNELQIPKTEKPTTEWLAGSGENTWKAIQAGNPDAVWVIQGWTFGYKNWKPEYLAALFSKVPNDRMLVLDYANDYSTIWKKFAAFYGKDWAFGYVPNMGGKTAYTGNLAQYASASAKMLQEPSRGALKGFTISGEGLENNEAVYELLTDAAWHAEPIDLDSWFVRYSTNRYGACPPSVTESWNLLRQGCYARLIPHPSYGWQKGGGGSGGVDKNPNFILSTQQFLSCAGQLKQSPAYRADAVERAALALSLRANHWYALAHQANAAANDALFDQASARTLELLTQVDRLMEAHPLNRLESWIRFARSHSNDPKLQQDYESNARSIVTYWGPGVQNYACRVWGGLVRDYYREWARRDFESLRQGTRFDANAFMIEYAKGTGTSAFIPCADPLADAKAWLDQAMTEKIPVVAPVEGSTELISQWSPGQVTAEWKTLEWPIPAQHLPKLKGIVFNYTSGNHRLDIQSVALVCDGKVVVEDPHFGYAGVPNSRNRYKLPVPAGTTANNSCLIRASVRIGHGGNNSKGSVHLLFEKP